MAAQEEAEELLRCAPGDDELDRMLARRLAGEPLAWITGSTTFCGIEVIVAPGVYVPRWQSEPLATMAAALLPRRGVGVDLCTGSGAVALVMQRGRPDAQVVATESDAVAARCARGNGVDVYEGDLDQPLPTELASRVDVMAGVLPYVPHDALHLLPRDVQHFEPRLALDGGRDGLDLISRAVNSSTGWLRGGGWLLLEIGGDQAPDVAALLAEAGYDQVGVVEDDDGDARRIQGRLRARTPSTLAG